MLRFISITKWVDQVWSKQRLSFLFLFLFKYHALYSSFGNWTSPSFFILSFFLHLVSVCLCNDPPLQHILTHFHRDIEKLLVVASYHIVSFQTHA